MSLTIDAEASSYNNAVFKEVKNSAASKTESNQKNLMAFYAGYLSTITHNKSNILSLFKFPLQYIPNKNDLVIGIVKVRASEHFIVDINAPLDAILGAL